MEDTEADDDDDEDVLEGIHGIHLRTPAVVPQDPPRISQWLLTDDDYDGDDDDDDDVFYLEECLGNPRGLSIVFPNIPQGFPNDSDDCDDVFGGMPDVSLTNPCRFPTVPKDPPMASRGF